MTPATVTGNNPAAEASVIAEQQWRAIQERRAAGTSVSGIARELDLDRKTVRGALKRKTWQPYRRESTAPTLLDAHRAWLLERAPQVHYSARILYQELTQARGFTGCYETVKLAVRQLRAEATLAGRQVKAPLKLPMPALEGVLRRVAELANGQADSFTQLDVEPHSSKSIFV
jgi:transposase